MKRPFRMPFLLLFLFLTSWLLDQHALAGDVIANDSITLDAEEIRDVFLGEKQFSEGIKLVPVDNSALQQLFLSNVLQSDSSKYYARWTKKTYREGIAAPMLKESDAEVIDFVRSTRGAVSYVTKAPAGVRVLQTF